MRPPSVLSIAAVWMPSLTWAVPYGQYILAPSTRNIHASMIYQVNGSVANSDALTRTGQSVATFSGASAVTLDFGVNIAGIVTVTAGQSSSTDAIIWLTYTESNLWINGDASDGTADTGLDAPLPLNVGQGPGAYAVDQSHERGGFRYLSLINNSSASIEITNVVVYYTAAPTQDLQAYTGYFHSNDELLNRIWYAGAYTNQLCSIDPTHGNAIISLDDRNAAVITSSPPTNSWYNNYTITNGRSALVDGAKRDRLVWPGDMAISLPSIAYSTFDLESTKNSLESLLVLQNPDGRLPYAGLPLSKENITSFTYHLHCVIGVTNYYHFSGDESWLEQYWVQLKSAVGWSLGYIDSSGLMNVTSAADWLRAGMGGHNIEANAILYYVLDQVVSLAKVLNDTAAASTYSSVAATLKSAAGALLWDDSAGLYVDNEGTSLHPQDGNAFAVLANLTLSADQKSAISSALHSRWTEYGAPAPEVQSTPDTISPFASGFELEAHFLAGAADWALELIRRQWGFMLDDPRMTNSTFIEGFSADGSLHYAPYSSDPRVSHAHGWSTAPTSLLSRYVAGLQLTTAAGKTWRIDPNLGDLNRVEAGMRTGLGDFAVNISSDAGTVFQFSFETPAGTSGDVVLPPATKGSLKSASGTRVVLEAGRADSLEGGEWVLETATRG